MDLSNYEAITKLVKAMCPTWTPEDQQDLMQDVCVKLLKSKLEHASKNMLRKIIWQLKCDKQRKPKLIYNTELVEGTSADV
jgi:DNA-directed RNA polymerase specialized sigma24 family protein